MPDMANIVVKMANGTTDITYSKAAASAGDKSPAVWKSESVGTVLAGRPTLTLTSMNNGTRKSRRLRASYIYPKVRTDAQAQTIVVGGASAEASFLVPQDMTAAEINEYANQFANLLASALIKSSVTSGYAPT